MIRVQFLYDPQDYNYPITCLVNELRKHGVQLEAVHCIDPEQAAKERKQVDLLLVSPEFFPGEEYCSKNCVAIVSHADGGWIAPNIHLLKYVKGFIESYAYTPRELHNEKYYFYNLELLKRAGYSKTCESDNVYNVPDVSNAELKKIHVFCGFGSWERVKDIRNSVGWVDLKRERTNSIFFAGTVDYAGTEIGPHRLRAVEVCNRVGGVGAEGRPYLWPEYRDLFLNSKAILSPWGWGEACHRDFDALAFGCVLIKPDWSFVESYPDISSKNAPYIPCRLDFEDVPEIVDRLEKHWHSYQALRERGLKLVQDALDIRKNSIKFKEIVQCLMG